MSFFVGRMVRRRLERLHARTVEMNGLTSSDGHHGVPTLLGESYSETEPHDRAKDGYLADAVYNQFRDEDSEESPGLLVRPNYYLSPFDVAAFCLGNIVLAVGWIHGKYTRKPPISSVRIHVSFIWAIEQTDGEIRRS